MKNICGISDRENGIDTVLRVDRHRTEELAVDTEIDNTVGCAFKAKILQ
jgi:hypothetical protein